MKKFLTYSVVAATMAWSMGISAVLPAAAATAYVPTDGDIVKVAAANRPGVYYIMGGKKYLFVNRVTYTTWASAIGDTADSFKGLKGITQAEFDALDLGGNITARAGASIIKFDNSDLVYAVAPGAKLCKLADTAAKTALYGAATPILIQSAFETGYTKDASCALTASSKYPDGTLIKSGTSYFYIEGGLKKAVGTDAFAANGFKDSWSRSLADTSAYTSGADVSGKFVSVVASASTAPVVITGTATVSLSSATAASKDVPENTSVEFLTLNFTAGSDADVSVNGIKFSAAGLGDYNQINGVTVYSNGLRYGNSRDIDSNKQAQINFTSPILIAKGTSQTVLVKASVSGTGKYALAVNAASDISATAAISGNFPIVGNTMAGNAVTVAKLAVDTDGASLSDVKLGDTQAILGKFKLTNDNIEDVTFKAITLKKDSVSTAADSDLANLKLYMDGSVVATGGSITNRYVSFNLTNPVTILKSQVKRFVVEGDVVGGAGKAVTLVLDITADVNSIGNYYGYQTQITNNLTTGNSVKINAGAVTLTKINAVNTKLKKDSTNVEFGTFDVTVNSGKNVELSTLKLTIASTNDAAGAQLENVEVFLSNTNTTYDLTSSTSNGVYKNTSMGLVLTSGITYHMVVRADIKSTAINGDYTVSIADAAGGDMVLKETSNDQAVTDITPNSVSLNKVQVEASSVTFSKNALSTGYTAVVGTSDIEMMNFNIAAGQSTDVNVTELTFKDLEGTPSSSKAVISEYKLWKVGSATPLQTVSANNIVSPTVAPTITFTNLNDTVKLGQTNAYRMTLSLVNDINQGGKKLKYGLSAYSIEDTDKGAALYDTAIDSATGGWGVVDGTGITAMTSAREVTIQGKGAMSATVDNTIIGTNAATYQLAGQTGVALGSYKLKSDNESSLVKSVKVVSSQDMSASISKLSLYKEGVTEPVAWTTTIGATTSTFNQDFTVGNEAVYTLKADLYAIGQNQTGALEASSTFKLSSFDVEGASSGATITVVDSGVSLETAVVASKIAAVSLETTALSQSIASSIVTGVSGNVAIIKVTASTFTNTNTDGTQVKLLLSKIKVKVDGGITTTASSIERIGGAASATSSSATSTSYLTFAGLSGADYQLASGETAYYLVKLTPVFSATYTGQYGLKASLDALNSATASTTDNTVTGNAFSWKDRSDALVKSALRVSSISTVDGYLIKN